MGNSIKRCPECGNGVSVHLEGWFYDHTKSGHGYDELCPGSGVQAPQTEAADRVAEAVTEAVRDYQTVFPVPYKLSPNLRLAVDALAERDRAEATIARVRKLADESRYLAPFDEGDEDCVLVADLQLALTEEAEDD